MLYVGQSIIVPLIYATIFAILLNRVVNFLHRYKLNRVLAIVITIILTMTFFGMLVFFIASQMSMFSEAFPELKEKFNELLSMIVSWVSSEFNISTPNINSWIKQTKQDAVENSNLLIGKTLTTVSGLLIVILLLPVYIFMLLFYKPLLLEFIKKLFHRTEHGTVAEVLVESKTVIQSYLIGLLIETAIVAALNAIGLLILGVDYANTAWFYWSPVKYNSICRRSHSFIACSSNDVSYKASYICFACDGHVPFNSIDRQ
jgi:predicted PurR-regulated permease PerM